MDTLDVLSRMYVRVSLQFLFQVIPAVLLFCLSCKRKPHTRFRGLLSIPHFLVYSVIAISVYIWHYDTTGSSSILAFLLAYILLLLGVFLFELFLFQVSVTSLLFNLLGGFALHQLGQFLFYLIYYPISSNFGVSPSWGAQFVIEAIWLALAYTLSYFTFIKKQNIAIENDDTEAKNPALYLSLVMSLFFILFELVRNGDVTPYSRLDYICIICQAFFYILVLLLRGGLLKIIRTEKERILTQRIWEEKEKSLRLTADAVNLVNIKYHDLKHMLSKLSTEDDALGLATSIANSLKAYENNIVTGNDTLDIVLTEQTLRFNQNGITFSCIADGSSISFMETLDIISLFSNALDNAYEAVIALPQEKREVYLTVRQTMGMASIVVENPHSTSITVQNGLPVTTKQDKEYHGFGVKSIRTTVEKYGGDLAISTDDSWFKLKILIPGKH